jgi:chromosomal replication initiator protein
MKNYYVAPGIDLIAPRHINLLSVVAKYHHVSLDALKVKSRLEQHIRPRQIAMWILRKKTRMSLKEIGQMFNQSHCTVVYTIKVIDNEIETNSNIGKTALEINGLC